MAARSTLMRLHNRTNYALHKTDDNLDHGVWTDPNQPPEAIAPGQMAFIESESDGVLTGTEGTVRYRWDGAPGQSWGDHAPFPITPGGTAQDRSVVAVVARTPDHLDVFWVGPDGAVATQWWDAAPGQSWADHPPFPVTPPGAAQPGSRVAAVARTQNHLDLFWVGPDGAIGSQWWDAAPGMSWSDHAPFPITPPGAAAQAGSGIAAVARTPDHLDVFWEGPDGAIGSQWWDAAPGMSWADHHPFPITPPGAAQVGSRVTAVARTPSHLDVFWIGPDGAIASQWWDAAPGLSWGDHGPFAVTPPGAAQVGSGIGVVARTPDHLDLFWDRPDGAIGTQWWDAAPGMSWADHAPFPITPPGAAQAGSQVTTVARTSNHLDVFWVGPDGAVATQWWDAAAGQGWADHGPFPITPPGAAQAGSGIGTVARTPDHLDVFWIGPDRAIASQWWDAAPGPGAELYFHWDNPYDGRNSYAQATPTGSGLCFSGGTGDNAELDLQLVPRARVSVRGFLPSTKGFRFSNTTWPSEPLKRIIKMPDPFGDITIGNASNGICGGMAYAAADYYAAGLRPPTTTVNPGGIGDPLFDYLVDRLFNSFDLPNGPLTYWQYMDPLYPDTPRVDAVGRAWVMAHEGFPSVMAAIDNGGLCPLGLVMVKSVLPTDLGENHQVLAYAYQLDGGQATVWVYDPNAPLRDDIMLSFDLSDAGNVISVTHNVNAPGPIYAFFVTPYGPRVPSLGWAPFPRPQSSSFAVTRMANHLDVFWGGPDRAIATQWWDAAPGLGWTDHSAFPIAPQGASQAGSGVTAVARTPDHLDVFWVGPDGAIATQWWDRAPGQGWGDHGPFPITPPGAAQAGSRVTAVARTPDHLDVFWVGPDGAIGTQWWDAAPGQSWADHAPFPITPPGAASAGSGLAAVARTPGHLDVFWVGPDGAIGTQWWDGAPGLSWGDHAPFAVTPPGAAQGESGVAAAARTPDHLDVFWEGPDGAVATQWWDAAAGQGWADHGPFPITPPGAALTGSGVAVVARTPEHLDVFWEGPDGAIGTQWWDAAAGQGWADHGPFPITPPGAARAQSGIAAVARTPNHLDVFWLGPDGAIGTQWWDAAPGMSWADHAPFPITPPGAAQYA